MLYFAYGSNMLHTRIQNRVPSARVVEMGILLNHSLRFHKVSKDGSGKCDAYETDNALDSVFGVVYKMSRKDKRALDKAEGRHYGYEMKWVQLLSRSGNVYKAFTYYATKIDKKSLPFESYKQIVIKGAEQNDLPKSYVQKIKKILAKQDPPDPVELAKKSVHASFNRGKQSVYEAFKSRYPD